MNPPTIANMCAEYWGAQSKLRVFTYVLCTFTFMQVFNYVNCRKIGQSEINVFERMFTKVNWYFWIILGFTSLVQILMVQWFHAFTRTTPLTRSEWGACVVAGSSNLIIAALLKLTGPGLLKKIPFTKFIDEDKEAQDQLVQSIAKINNTDVNFNTDFMKGRKNKKTLEPEEGDNDYQNFNGV